MQVINGDLKIISGMSSSVLARAVCDYLGVSLTPLTLKTFADGELYVRVEENIRGKDVFVIQSTCTPANDNLMELMILIDALKRSSAGRITAVIPYYGYARQDRKAASREPITAKLVANLITSAGADRVVSVDLHCGQIQGFFDIPLDHLSAFPLFISEIRRREFEDAVIVSPDAGGAKKARKFASALNLPMVLLDKRRVGHNEVSEVRVIGELSGKTAIIIDDLIDTAGTMSASCKALIESGAKEVFVFATHPVLSGDAVSRLNIPEIKEVIVTNTIPIPKSKLWGSLTVLSLAPLLGEGIKGIHNNESLSVLFNSES